MTGNFSGFVTELPETVMSLEGEVDFNCDWGSSDTPATVVWQRGRNTLVEDTFVQNYC